MRQHAEIINDGLAPVEPPPKLVQSTGQWGGTTPKAGGRMLDGRTWDGMPTAAPGPRVGVVRDATLTEDVTSSGRGIADG